KTASASLTSHASAMAGTSPSVNSRQTPSAAARLTSTQATAQPARPKARAVASPSPLPAPVMKTALLFRGRSTASSLLRWVLAKLLPGAGRHGQVARFRLRSLVGQQGLVERGGALGNGPPGEFALDPRPSGPAHPIPELGPREELMEAGGQRLRVTRRDQVTGHAIPDGEGDAADRRTDHRPAAGHRL